VNLPVAAAGIPVPPSCSSRWLCSYSTASWIGSSASSLALCWAANSIYWSYSKTRYTFPLLLFQPPNRILPLPAGWCRQENCCNATDRDLRKEKEDTSPRQQTNRCCKESLCGVWNTPNNKEWGILYWKRMSTTTTSLSSLHRKSFLFTIMNSASVVQQGKSVRLRVSSVHHELWRATIHRNSPNVFPRKFKLLTSRRQSFPLTNKLLRICRIVTTTEVNVTEVVLISVDLEGYKTWPKSRELFFLSFVKNFKSFDIAYRNSFENSKCGSSTRKSGTKFVREKKI